MDVKKSLPGRFHVAMADVKTGRCFSKNPMVAESTFSKRENSLMESIPFFCSSSLFFWKLFSKVNSIEVYDGMSCIYFEFYFYICTYDTHVFCVGHSICRQYVRFRTRVH